MNKIGPLRDQPKNSRARKPWTVVVVAELFILGSMAVPQFFRHFTSNYNLDAGPLSLARALGDGAGLMVLLIVAIVNRNWFSTEDREKKPNSWIIFLTCMLFGLYSVILVLGPLRPDENSLQYLLVDSKYSLIASVVLVPAVLAPLAEELFFRGWLWSRLSGSWSVTVISIVTSFLWWSPYLLWQGIHALIIAPLVIALPILRHLSGGLLAPYLVHLSYNVCGAFILIFLSDFSMV